jgi:hypothetical protein
MVARNPFTGLATKPTVVVHNDDGTVETPNDPQIATNLSTGPAKPETLHSGYAQGGTNNPTVGDDGKVHYYAPEDRREGGVGAREESAVPMFERDAETNPVPHGGPGRFAARLEDATGGVSARENADKVNDNPVKNVVAEEDAAAEAATKSSSRKKS